MLLINLFLHLFRVLAGAATCFYAFVGFDSIAVSGEEAKNPSKSIPIATVVALSIVTIGYILVSATLTLMIPIDQINPSAALPEAFGSLNLEWAKYLISIGALCGMTTTLLGSLYALPRCLYAMASDGLLFSFFGRVNATTQIPLFNLALSGFLSALLALLFDLEKLVEFMSIGTLLAYTIVSASVLVLRYRPIGIEETHAPDTPGTDEEKYATSSSSSGNTSLADLDASPSSEILEAALVGRLKPQYRWLSVRNLLFPICFIDNLLLFLVATCWKMRARSCLFWSCFYVFCVKFYFVLSIRSIF